MCICVLIYLYVCMYLIRDEDKKKKKKRSTAIIYDLIINKDHYWDRQCVSRPCLIEIECYNTAEILPWL